MPITSTHNQRLKEIRKLRMRRRERSRAGRFVAEGEDLLEAADARGWTAVERYCATGSGLPGTEVEPELLASASGLASGTRALAVYEERWLERPVGPLCVYLHGVHDPGNVGTILRAAEAFGASSVALGPGTADPFSPKAVRASMGSIFGVPVAPAAGDPAALPGETVALVSGAGASLTELWPERQRYVDDPAKVRASASASASAEVTLMVGSERDGLPAEIVDRADQVAHIPIATHSLNAAMAVTVALYEVSTIRRAP